jgi:Uma2 family endonuclease
MPSDIRAELIGGSVYMPSPVSDDHGDFSFDVPGLLRRYVRTTPGVVGRAGATTMLDDQAEPEPDVFIRILPECGGASRVEGKYVAGPPEFVVEIARSSRPIDLGPKRDDYARAGVQEYVVIALDPDEVVWHVRRGDRFVVVPPSADGVYRSEALPGLWIDAQALVDNDDDALDAALDRGIASPEHVAFVARLAEARQRHVERGNEP